MADLLGISFPTEAQAEEARARVAAMQREYLIALGDAVVALRRPDGTIKPNQVFHPTAAGAAGGALWGSLLGLRLLDPFAGAAMGAAAGAIAGRLTDVGINDDFMKDVARSLEAGEAALFMLVRKMTADRVMEVLQGMGGKIMRSSFDETKEEMLRAALAGAAEKPGPAWPAAPAPSGGSAPRCCCWPRSVPAPAWPACRRLRRSGSSGSRCSAWRTPASGPMATPSRCAPISASCCSASAPPSPGRQVRATRRRISWPSPAVPTTVPSAPACWPAGRKPARDRASTW
jgi:uncharacterized membrane protein